MSKRDQTCNLNFFTKVLLDDSGHLEFADGISGAEKYVDLLAEMDGLVLVSNCAQLNNPCNDYNPTPVEMIIWIKRSDNDHVYESIDCKPRRNRLPHHPHAQKDGGGVRCRLFGPGRDRRPRPAGGLRRCGSAPHRPRRAT